MNPFPTVLLFHIVAGSVGILTGLLALASSKGSRFHIGCGIAFWHSMIAMAGSGIVLAIMHPRPVFVLIAVLSLYLVSTGRNALRRAGGLIGRATRAWFAVAVACFASGLGLGLWSISTDPDRFGDPAFLFFGVAFDALIFVLLDWRLIRNGGAVGTSRIIDHLWRMIAALLFALFALFVANPQIFPAWLTDTGLNLVPSILMLVLIAYWVIAVKRRPGAHVAARIDSA